MIELRESPYKPGKEVSCSCKVFYTIYKDGRPLNRTHYSTIRYAGEKYKGILVLNKRTLSEIKPSILDVCREKYKNYPRYTMSEDIVVINGETGKEILDTKQYVGEIPYIISDYMFCYKNTLYDNNGNIIQKFSSMNVIENDTTYIVQDGNRYSNNGEIYIFDKKGNLLSKY